MLRYLLLLVAVLAFSGPARAEEDDATAKRLYELQLEQAEKGDPQAQYYLGEMHEYGLGTPENEAAALDWYRRAASQKHLLAARKVRELTAAKAQPKTPVPAPAPVESAPPPAAVARPAPTKPNAEAAKAAEAKADVARAAAAEKEAQRQAELEAKRAAAEKEKRRAKAKAALERMKADVKKNGVGY